MSSDSFHPPFTIRRVPRNQEPTSPPTPPTPSTSKKPPTSAAAKSQPAATTAPAVPAEPVADEPTSRTGGRFRTAGSALSFLSSLAGSRLAREASLRRAANGDWWVETPAAPDAAAELVAGAGGAAYVKMKRNWQPVAASGGLPSREAKSKSLDVKSWPQVELSDLLAQSRLASRRHEATPAVHIVATGSVGRWALDHCVRHGLQVRITPVLRQSLAGGPESGALWLQATAATGAHLTIAFQQSLADMPFATVARAVTASGPPILVDVRCHAPSVLSMLGELSDTDGAWLLGSPDAGHWRMRRAGADIAAADLVCLPDIPIQSHRSVEPTPVPSALPARLVHRSGVDRRADAVLLDDSDLTWLRTLLPTHSAADLAFLLPGPGRHLLLIPGGHAESIPLGLPLSHLGPFGLFVERGCEFSPPLPSPARMACFGLTDEASVVVTRGGAFRFPFDRLTPAWTLWTATSPPVSHDVSAAGHRLLATISAAYEQQLVERSVEPPLSRQPVDPRRRQELITAAAQAEARGEFQRAAELLEAAGQPGPAGRLYERTAK